MVHRPPARQRNFLPHSTTLPRGPCPGADPAEWRGLPAPTCAVNAPRKYTGANLPAYTNPAKRAAHQSRANSAGAVSCGTTADGTTRRTNF